MASAVYPSSCEPCRRRKSRCNRIKPCANCELRGISDECYVKAPRIEARKAQARNASRASSRSTGQTAAQHPVRSEGAQVHQTASDDGAFPSSTSSIPAPLTDLPTTTWAARIQPLQHGKVGIGCSSDARDGGIHAKHLRLEDVSQYLPSVSLCDKFLRFFFDEVSVKSKRMLKKTTGVPWADCVPLKACGKRVFHQGTRLSRLVRVIPAGAMLSWQTKGSVTLLDTLLFIARSTAQTLSSLYLH